MPFAMRIAQTSNHATAFETLHKRIERLVSRASRAKVPRGAQARSYFRELALPRAVYRRPQSCERTWYLWANVDAI